jgi:feruloyl esterase
MSMRRGGSLTLLAVVAFASPAQAAQSRATQASAAQRDCAALAGNQGGGVQITAATAIAPQESWSPPAALGAPSPVTVPFCRVEGMIEKRIGFELWMPPASAWNGRLLGAGVGGDAGVFNFRDLARGVAAGFASSTTDGGHKSNETHWMMRRDAVLDYTHRAQHLTNLAVRKIVARYYGSGPHHAYFLGCSGGGRQGLKEAQRFAADYDGIVAGAGGPRMPEMSVRHLWHALYQQNHPEGALDAAAWSRVSAAAIQACDADDGAIDGVVDYPPSCRFDVGALQCGTSPTQGCLSAAQVQTVRTLQQPLRDEKGRALDSGLLPGVTVRPGPPSPLLLPFFAEGAHRDPNWNPATFRIGADLALARKRMPEMAADDADLRRFDARGGKLILYQGWLDPSIIASQSLDYAAAVRAKMGARSDAMLRLYMVPGMPHCGGGDGVNQFGGSGSALPIGAPDRDLLSAVVDWVEHGKAPQGITGVRQQSGRVTRERLLCPSPLVARPVNTDAANQHCEPRAPQ